MPQIAILAAIEVGLAVAQFALTPRGGKQQPQDRGKQGDLRFTIAQEGEPFPYAFGRRVRMAGVMIDYGRTKELKSSSPGSSGGKKGQGGTPPTTNYSYTKTFAIAFTANEMKSFRQVKEDDQIILDLIPENATSNFYEGEDSGNTFTAPTAVAAQAQASNGNEITLQSPGNGAVQFNSVLSNVSGTRTLVIYYRNDTNTDIELTVNGGAPATYTLNNTGGTNYATREIDITCVEGTNTIKIKNLHTTHNVGLDRIYLFAGLPSTDDFNPRRTGVVADIDYPSDEDDPSPFYDAAPYPSTSGVVTGNLATNGQVPFELFLGKSDQPQSDILLSLPGRDSSNTPAYEELSLFIAQNYVIQEGRQTIGNITAELEPKLQYLDEVLEFLFTVEEQIDPARLDFSAGAQTLMEGFIFDRREAVAPFVASLAEAYGFDIIPEDGKLVLKMRNGAAVFDIPEEEMYGREEGQEPPHGPITTEHNPEIDVPVSVDVQYLDPSSTKEYHTADAHYSREVGNSADADTLVLPLVMERDSAIAIGKRYIRELKLRSKPKSLATGPRYRHLTPGDIGTLTTETTTEKIVLTSTQAAFTGLVKFQGVPAKGALYSQLGPANPADSEKPPVPHPANTFLMMADVPAVRDADENQFVTLVAMCGRGTGKWRGGHLFKEHVPDTDEWDRIISLAHPATAGVLVSDLAGVADPTAVDTTHSVVIDLLFDEGLFESRPLDDIQAKFVNVIIIPSTREIIQFTDATYTSSSFPYTKRVTLNGHLLRGCRGSIEGALSGASAGAGVFLLTDAIGSFIENVGELNTSRNFKGVTVGQAVDNASTTAYTCDGYSARGPQPDANEFICNFDKFDGDALFEAARVKAKLQSGQEGYEFQASVPAGGSFSSTRGNIVKPNQQPQTNIWPSNLTSSLTHVGGGTQMVNVDGKVIANGGVYLVVVDHSEGNPTVPGISYNVGLPVYLSVDDEDIILEFQIPNDGVFVGKIGIGPYSESLVGSALDGAHALWWEAASPSSGPPFPSFYEIFPSDGVGTPGSPSIQVVPGDRFGIKLRADGLPEFTLNHLGPTTRPVWASSVPALREKYVVAVQLGFVCPSPTTVANWAGTVIGVKELNIVRPNPEWRYIAEAQKVDNSSSLPSSIKARVRQLSFVAGGPPSAWTTKTFTRP